MLPISCRDMSEISHHGLVTSAQTLPPGARIERHRHPQHQIVYPSSGAVSVTTPAGTWITPANRAIWIPAGCWHEHKFHGTTQFHGVALDPGRYRRGPRAPAVLAVSPLMRELIIACSQADGTETAEHHRMLAVLHDQVRATGVAEPLWIPTPVDPRLRQACALIADNLREPLTLQQIGDRVGVGQRTLSRLFSDELAMTFPNGAPRSGCSTPSCCSPIGAMSRRWRPNVVGPRRVRSSTPTGGRSATPWAAGRRALATHPARAPRRRRTAPAPREPAHCHRAAGGSPGSPPASGWCPACR